MAGDRDSTTPLQRLIDDSADAELTLHIAAPSGDFALLEQWLDSALQVEPLPVEISAQGSNRDTAGFLRAALQLTVALQNAAGLPLFRCARVVDTATTDTGQLALQLRLPQLANFPLSAVTEPLLAALEICQHALSTPRNEANQIALMDYLQNEKLPQLRRGLFSGTATVPLLRAIAAAGIPYLHLGAGIYQLGCGSRQRKIRNSASDRDSVLGAKLASDKWATAQLLRQMALPAPRHALVNNAEQAQQAAQLLGWPLVVKPVAAERGEGISVNLRDADALSAALTRAQAAAAADSVLVEQQLPGVCHRLFVANGQLLYCVARHPVAVTGNGFDTLAALTTAAYQQQRLLPPWLREQRPPFDTATAQHFAALGLSGDTVPAAGQRVTLRPIESSDAGGIDEDMTQRVHPDNVALALKATAALGLEIAGIDLITTDISQPWHQSGAAINEVNFTPQFCGAAISRSYLSTFLDSYLPDGGVIPIEYFSPQQLTAAKQRWQQFHQQGLQCALLHNSQVLLSDGSRWTGWAPSQQQLLRALLLDASIDALVVVSGA